MGNVRSKFQIYIFENYYGFCLYRLNGILANLERNRQKRNTGLGTGRRICFAGRKLMFPVPSDEEGAKACFEALEVFSMMIHHHNQD